MRARTEQAIVIVALIFIAPLHELLTHATRAFPAQAVYFPYADGRSFLCVCRIRHPRPSHLFGVRFDSDDEFTIRQKRTTAIGHR
jgi:hypothetical protein